jgi:hypothetical protein
MDKKKLAAAMSAVFAYIKTSEEAAFHAAQAFEPAGEAGAQLHQVMQPGNLWGISGRQTQMQANNMMQLRMFK